jgi:RNA polymerase sigma-70 factor (ECF subfamily)
MESAMAIPSGRDDARLVQAATTGDVLAFERLMQAYAGRVYRLALRMVGDPDDAADIQQEVFIQAYRNLRRFRGDASLSTWLYTITARQCIAWRRAGARQPAPVHPELASPCPDPPDPASALAAAQVRQALGELKPAERLLILLKYVEGLSHGEMAEVIGCTPKSARTRLARARRRLRARLEAQD